MPEPEQPVTEANTGVQAVDLAGQEQRRVGVLVIWTRPTVGERWRRHARVRRAVHERRDGLGPGVAGPCRDILRGGREARPPQEMRHLFSRHCPAEWVVLKLLVALRHGRTITALVTSVDETTVLTFQHGSPAPIRVRRQHVRHYSY